ncbi:calcium channel flower homolog [Exaiptasia diaphana]|uniref:Calcium channel flower n=1 Tax=Exaiptasia diaphana TaxID=2652724 RepID=A0A913XK17_EXADI|nr:calcium channel flower homolog [Exaiptasia diaphana]KXJ20295.1 Calcium channel flower-like [Exaiptasia diaphana]
MADSTPNSDVPKGMRLVVRAWGAFSALCCAAMGFFVLFTLSAKCFGSGLLMIFLGIFVMAFEVPACCQYMGWMVTISNWVEKYFKFWMRGCLYFGIGLAPIIMCLQVSTFVGSGAVIITAALYGVLAIGRKGGAASQNQEGDDVEMKTGLVDKSGNPATTP